MPDAVCTNIFSKVVRTGHRGVRFCRTQEKLAQRTASKESVYVGVLKLRAKMVKISQTAIKCTFKGITELIQTPETSVISLNNRCNFAKQSFQTCEQLFRVFCLCQFCRSVAVGGAGEKRSGRKGRKTRKGRHKKERKTRKVSQNERKQRNDTNTVTHVYLQSLQILVCSEQKYKSSRQITRILKLSDVIDSIQLRKKSIE